MNVSKEEIVDCSVVEQPLQFERFILVSICGTTVAIWSIIENIFLCFMLFSKQSYRSSHFLYLALLAFFDIFIAGAYIPLMSLSNVVEYMKSVPLLRAWYAYMIPMITISHIAMTASSFLMVAASFERYCITARPKYVKFLNKHRFKIAAGSVVIGILTKVTHGLEFAINKREECIGTMGEFVLEISEDAKSEIYMAFWKIWVRSVFTILFPFFLLAFLNARIVIAIQKKEFQFISAQKLSDAKRKSRVRAATRTLVFIVFTYLLSNVLNVIITIWEYFDADGLQIQFESFYMIAVDLVSFLTVFAGALRLPIYMTCQKELRKDFASRLKRFCSFGAYREYDQSVVTAIQTVEDQSHSQIDDETKPYTGLFIQLGTVLIKKDSSDDTLKSTDS